MTCLSLMSFNFAFVAEDFLPDVDLDMMSIAMSRDLKRLAVLCIIVVDGLNNGGEVSGDVFHTALFMKSKLYSSIPFCECRLIVERDDLKTVGVGV